MSLPLAGMRVVEVAQYVAGPLAGSLLAELGAEVVKVEPPGGDAYRRVMPVGADIGRYFVPLNRGKRSVVLDLKSAEGRASLATLVATADVVLHNAPPARAEAFGLGWEDLHAAQPALVVGVVTSFGRARPARRRAGLRPRRPGALGSPHRARVPRATGSRCGLAGSRWPT